MEFSKWQNFSQTNYSPFTFSFLHMMWGNDNAGKCVTLDFPVLTSRKKFSENYLEISSISLDVDEVSLIKAHSHLRDFSFISFFLNNLIDVPIYFTKSKSLKRKNFEILVLKFANLLMKKGKKEKIVNLLFGAFTKFFEDLRKKSFSVKYDIFKWVDLYLFLNSTFTHSKSNVLFSFKTPLLRLFNQHCDNEETLLNKEFFFYEYLLSRISQVSPIFSFFVYANAKNLRKFSRKKAVKYIYVWKYLPPYKRTHVALHWLIKDVKFSSGADLIERVSKTLELLTFSPKLTHVWQCGFFSHRHVFKNFKKTLMVSLKTSR